MSKMQIQALALVVLLVPLPLIALGANAGIGALWWLGLALLVAGGLVPVVMRYGSAGDEDG